MAKIGLTLVRRGPYGLRHVSKECPQGVKLQQLVNSTKEIGTSAAASLRSCFLPMISAVMSDGILEPKSRKPVMMSLLIVVIINLIYIAQFDTNGVLTVLSIVIKYIQMQYVHVWTYIKQSYS